MLRKSVAEWLKWQESLSPQEIDLGLERVRELAERLGLDRGKSPVFMIGGTNGKGSSAIFLEQILLANGFNTGCYTSPHLVRYNERIRLAGEEVDDASLSAAFEAIEAVRADTPLTYFEFGTLAAVWLSSLAGAALESVSAGAAAGGTGGRSFCSGWFKI